MIRSHLDRANRYIAELRADIARERVVIEHALDAGYPSAVAESMLHALEAALRIFEKHRGLILDELERQPSRVADRSSARAGAASAGGTNFDDANYTIGNV